MNVADESLRENADSWPIQYACGRRRAAGVGRRKVGAGTEATEMIFYIFVLINA